jgi:hypothetical protein
MQDISLAEGMERNMARPKIRHLILAAIALAIPGVGVGTPSRSMSALQGQEPGGSTASADSAALLQENLKDRRELLLKAFNQRMEQWQAGNGRLHPLKDNLRALARVCAELSSSKKERVAGLEECVKLARDLLKVTEAKVQGALATEADGLEVKVLLLEVQAELLREQTKTVPTVENDRLTRENYDRIKLRTTTYKEVVDLLGEPNGTNRPLARGERLQAVWVVGSKRINVVFANDVVALKKASGIPGAAP